MTARARGAAHAASLQACRRAPPERGFALVLVIWVLALLAALAAAIAHETHSGALLARSQLDLAQARELANSGVVLATMGLIDPDEITRWRADGAARTVHYADGTVIITVQDEGGKIDVNEAPMILLDGVLAVLGVSTQEHDALLGGIAERRRVAASSAKARATGALLSDTDALPADRKDAPFADLSELRLLPGLSGATFERIRPFLTVYSGRPTVNPLTAPDVVLLAIPGVTRQDLAFFRAAGARAATAVEPPALPASDRFARVRDLRAVTINARATMQSGVRYAREAVIAISPTFTLRPFRVLRWLPSVMVDTSSAAAP
jgi:general secretion pathway protein K